MTPLRKARSGTTACTALVFIALTALLLPICQRAAGQSLATPGTRASQPSAAGTQKPTVQPANPGVDPLAPLVAEAQQALDHQDFSAAIPLLEKISAARPQEALPHFEIGYAYSELKRNEDAAKEYRRALELDPSLAAAHLNLGLVLIESDPAAALESFRHAEALQPDQGQPHYLAGRALERERKASEALEEYRTAVQLTPKDLPMRFALAHALSGAGRDAEAEAQFREALALPGDTGPAQLGLAELLVQEKKPAEAAEALAAYLVKMPDDRDARFEHAVILENLGRLDDALGELDILGKQGDPSADALKLRGNIYSQQKRWTEAAAALQKAAEILPGDAEVFGSLGRAQIESHNYPEAIVTLRRSLSINPAQVPVMRSLAEASYLSGQYAATIQALAQVEQHEVLRPVDFFIRAICDEKMGQKADAETAYQNFLAQDHNSNPDQEWQAQQRLKMLTRELHGK
jgi:tetratricopeptide (TPR) repeat protein